MIKSETSARITLWVNRLIAVFMFFLLFLLPQMLKRWVIGPKDNFALLTAFYCCFPVMLYALWCMDGLMRNILRKDVFIPGNVRLIRHIRWCCVAVCLICVPAAIIYLPLLSIVLIMGFLALVISVVKSVMSAAVEIREENDLTV